MLRRISTLDLVLLRLRNMALEERNDRASEEIHRLIKVYQLQATIDGAGCLVVSAEITPGEWVAEQMELNKHRKPPPGYIPKPLRGITGGACGGGSAAMAAAPNCAF